MHATSRSYDLLLNGGKAELVLADPPYNVPISGHVCGLGEIQHREFAMASGEMTRQSFHGFPEIHIRLFDRSHD